MRMFDGAVGVHADLVDRARARRCRRGSRDRRRSSAARRCAGRPRASTPAPRRCAPRRSGSRRSCSRSLHPHSVLTGSPPSSAARSACQLSVAHLTRSGNSRTPAKTASLPSSLDLGLARGIRSDQLRGRSRRAASPRPASGRARPPSSATPRPSRSRSRRPRSRRPRRGRRRRARTPRCGRRRAGCGLRRAGWRLRARAGSAGCLLWSRITDLIELAQLGHQANTSRTRAQAAHERVDVRARVVERERRARPVAATPKRCISGCAQWWPGAHRDALARRGSCRRRAGARRRARTRTRRLVRRRAEEAQARHALQRVGRRTRAARCSWRAIASRPIAST